MNRVLIILTTIFLLTGLVVINGKQFEENKKKLCSDFEFLIRYGRLC